MGYYPIVMDLTDRRCLVVGGGEVALRKVLSLVEAGAAVTVIASKIDPRIPEVDGVRVEQRPWQEGDCVGYALVFAATDDRAINKTVSEEARQRAIPINVVDDPELCSFIVPASVRRGDLLISVTTSGKSPTLSKQLRRELEARYGPEYADFVDLLGELRGLVKAKHPAPEQREAVFSKLMDCGILELMSKGEGEAARKKALECI